MVGPGVNLATTKDGEAYNKLQRPSQHYLTSTAPPLPPTKPLSTGASSLPPTKRKRNNTYVTPGEKRRRIARAKAEADDVQTQGSSRDVVWGMKIALPGLDEEEVSSDDSAGDAVAYLRTVRSEACALPSFLTGSTSPHRVRITDGVDTNVIFEKGTFIAVNDRELAEDPSEKNPESRMPQDRYYELLLKRFYHLRTSIEQACQEAVARRREMSESKVPPEPLLAWSDKFAEEPPNIGLLTRLNEAAIYNGLQWCARSMAHATLVVPRHSCWAWSLLALVPDVGTLSYDKIGRIREVGQSAGLTAAALRKDGGQYCEPERSCHSQASQTRSAGAEATASDTEMSISGDEGEIAIDTKESDLARAQACVFTQLGDRLVQPAVFPPRQVLQSRRPTASGSSAEGGKDVHTAKENGTSRELGGSVEGAMIDLNTSATIDMILTIVAECFGQKDLLSYRRGW